MAQKKISKEEKILESLNSYSTVHLPSNKKPENVVQRYTHVVKQVISGLNVWQNG